MVKNLNNIDRGTSISIGANSGHLDQGTNTVAVGHNSGNKDQGDDSVSIGYVSGYDTQGYQCVAVGAAAGLQNQKPQAVAIGVTAGYLNQNTQATAVGYSAGYINQGERSVAVGFNSGYRDQGDNSVAIGRSAGYRDQDSNAVAIGFNAGLYDQQTGAVAIGFNAAVGDPGDQSRGQREGAIAIGQGAGLTGQNIYSVAIGTNTGQFSQGEYSIAIGSFSNARDRSIVLNASGGEFHPTGTDAFYVNPIRYGSEIANVLAWNKSTGEIIDVGQQTISGTVGTLQAVTNNGPTTTNNIGIQNNAPIHALTIGSAGNVYVNTVTQVLGFGDQGVQILGPPETPINIGYNQPDATVQQLSAIAIGHYSGDLNQEGSCISIGNFAGTTTQEEGAIAIGESSGTTTQQPQAVAIGFECAGINQGTKCIAIGERAGYNQQQSNAIAIGYNAGYTSQGEYSIAIGANSNALDNSIVLNASGTDFHPSGTDGFFVNPIRKIIPTASNMETANVLIHSEDGEILNFGLIPSVVLFRDTSTKTSVNSNVNYVNCFGGQSISLFNSVSLSFKFIQTTGFGAEVNSNVIIQFLDNTGSIITDITSYNNVSNGSYTGGNTDGFYISGNISSTTFAITEIRISPVGLGLAAYGVNIVPINDIGSANQEYVSGGRTESGLINVNSQTYGIRIRCPENNPDFSISDFTVVANLFA